MAETATEREITPNVVARVPVDLNDYFLLCRQIEAESGFPNVDDIDPSLETTRRSVFLEKVALCHCELSEMVEIARKGTLSGLAMRIEVADLIIRVGALAAACGMHEALQQNSADFPYSDADLVELEKVRPWLTDASINDVLYAKAAYNTTRPRMHGKAL